jgi:hypothetical protein
MSNAASKIELPRSDAGELQSHAWPGGYPLFYATQDGGTLCPGCARMAESEGLTDDTDDPQWCIVAGQVNWEDESLYCDHCSRCIESAYVDD